MRARKIEDNRSKIILSAVPGLASNVIFAIFNGGIGIFSRSAWFGSLSVYYILLSMMRFGAVKQEKRISRLRQETERMKEEVSIYRKNSILFLFMALVLGGMVILLELSLGGKTYPGFTIYAAAAYAFYKIIAATIYMIKIKRQKSPLLKILRRIYYIDACVSILTLQTAMFASFAKGEETFIKLMNGITGMGVCLIVVALGIQGIYSSKKTMGGFGHGSYTCSGR